MEMSITATPACGALGQSTWRVTCHGHTPTPVQAERGRPSLRVSCLESLLSCNVFSSHNLAYKDPHRPWQHAQHACQQLISFQGLHLLTSSRQVREIFNLLPLLTQHTATE